MMANTTTPSGSSASAFLATLIPVALLAGVFLVLFLLFRAKYQRVYRPRTYLSTLYEKERSVELPPGKFSWLKPFREISDEYVLNHQSLDGYLYLRFLKLMAKICFVGACITWPVLFPVNATAHGGQKQFDLLSFANIPKSGKNRYYAHVFIGWIFFSYVMWVITQEMIYFINLRHTYLLAPFNASKISSRTVLFTDVPAEYLSKEKLVAVFGTSLKRSWLATDCSDLEDLVEERDKDALKLEGAEIKLCKAANERRMKWVKKNDKRKDATPENAELNTPGSRYQKPTDRPTHKLGKIPFIGQKVDTIDWTRTELKRLVPEIRKSQAAHQKGEGKLLPAIFVEFTTQIAAETAFRRMTPKKSPHLNPRAISSTPMEIIWKNLRIKSKERFARKFVTNAFLTLMIIFWAIPVAVVGAISNINYLTNKVHFLRFIEHIPPVILGVVTGLLPSVLLSVLMALVPVVCRLMAKLSGEVTLARVELKCQAWYMAFQVVQVFLITTFASGASSVVTQIVSTPSMATTLLAQNLPKASNFYISYIIVQGLGIAAGNLLNIGSLVGFLILGKFLDKSPRKIFKRYITLGGLGWGSLYPQFGNLLIIAITYSIIAPLLLGFAAVGFYLVYLSVRYNLLYVLTNSVDTRGMAYARGIQQLMTGVYLAEVCLIGLFAINTAPGPLVLMIIFLVATAIYHATMRHALLTLTQYLPDSMEGDDQLAMFSHADHKSYDATKSDAPPSEAQDITPPNMFFAKKAGFLGRIFDPRKFQSHQTVRQTVPAWELARYDDGDLEGAYYNPAITSEPPVLWIARDEMGISQREVRDSSEVIKITDEYAIFEPEKGKIVWEQGDKNLMDMPTWAKRIDY